MVHTYFGQDNPSSYLEEAENVEMLTYKQRKTVDKEG